MTTAAQAPDRIPQPPLPPRPAAAVGYICTEPDPTSTVLFTAWCDHRAEADGWTLAQVVTDTDVLLPLAQRPGWRHVTELVTAGKVGAVITISRSMVADSATAWARTSDHLAALGAVLTTISSTARSCPAPGEMR